jgi:hypothetical protein
MRPLEAVMADLYKISKTLADYVDKVVAHLAVHMGLEPATFRVMDRMQIILQDALEGGDPEQMASVLRLGADLDR